MKKTMYLLICAMVNISGREPLSAAQASTGSVPYVARLDELDEHLISWPQASEDDHTVNLSRMNDNVALVANFVCDESPEYGWGCVSNPDLSLVRQVRNLCGCNG